MSAPGTPMSAGSLLQAGTATGGPAAARGAPRSMLASIAAFEWRYQVKSPVFWVGAALFFLLSFGATTVDTIQIGSRGNVNVNSPFAIVQTLGIMSVFAIFVVVAMVAGTVIRDDETGFAPILRSTRLTKGAYLVGRFSGAIAAALLVLAAVPLAIMIGAAMPFQDAEKVGPLRIGDYLWALFVFGLPTLLIIGAGFFALATATRSMMWTYVGAVLTLVLFSATRIWLRDLQHDTLSALSDPFGLSAFLITTKYWTASDRNTMLPPLAGLLLANRVLWTAIAAALFALAWRIFRFETRPGRAAAAPMAAVADTAAPSRSGALPMPRADATTRRAQFAALARFDMAFVFRSPAFFVLLFIGLVNGGISSWFVGEFYGVQAWPVTRLVVQALQGAFSFMPVVIAVYYAGELVWASRERRMHEMIDATAAPDWAHLVPKIAAIALVLSATSLAAVLSGMVVQLLKGYTRFELEGYLLWFWLPNVIGALQIAVLAVFVQVLVPQKFIGWGVMLVYIVATVSLAAAGFEHNLYNYAGAPTVPLSDFNGMARFWVGQSWYQFYWSAFATVLAVLAHGLWRRGVTVALGPRLRTLGRRLNGGALAIGGVAFVAWAASGAWIFYNTNVLNRYLPAPERDRLLADAERELLPFEKIVPPQITAVTLDVQLYPQQARAVTTGRFTIENKTAAPMAQLHVNWGERLRIERLELAGATLDKEYAPYRYRIYRLQPALQPGETRELAFKTVLEERGFSDGSPLGGVQPVAEGRPLTRVVSNGSFIDSSEIELGLGFSRNGLLKDRAKRRKYGLPADLRPATLEDESARARNEFTVDSDWVDADITVTTDADQTPVAPGRMLSDETVNGRRTVHFKSDAPIANFFSIQSARYAVRRDRLGPVELAVYYQPGHEVNVERMLKAMKASLALFSEKFAPYQFHQARILEFPAYAQFAQSFANTIPYSEDIGFLTRLGDDDKIDVVTYVTAHEIGHQWWGHQLMPADQQGASMLVETFAQYSALLVMEQLYGKEMMRKFLRYELDRYLRRRGGEVVEELPLARVEEQTYIHYQKGSLAMYWLKEAVGEDKVDRVLSRLLQQYAFKGAPYPNTNDFLRLLRAEAGPEHDQLITDLFEKITLWDVKAMNAKATKRADGRFDVSFEVEAKKFYADGHGKETEAPLDEPFDIGAFGAEPGRPGYSAASVLQFGRQRLHSGRQTVTLVLDRAPKFVGVDPYNKRIDRNSQDNLTPVEGS